MIEGVSDRGGSVIEGSVIEGVSDRGGSVIEGGQ